MFQVNSRLENLVAPIRVRSLLTEANKAVFEPCDFSVCFFWKCAKLTLPISCDADH